MPDGFTKRREGCGRASLCRTPPCITGQLALLASAHQIAVLYLQSCDHQNHLHKCLKLSQGSVQSVLRTTVVAKLFSWFPECALPSTDGISLFTLCFCFEYASSISVFWNLTYLCSSNGIYSMKLSFRREVYQSKILQHPPCNTLQFLNYIASC